MVRRGSDAEAAERPQVARSVVEHRADAAASAPGLGVAPRLRMERGLARGRPLERGGGCKCVRPAFGRLQKFALRFARGSGAGTVVARADC